MILMLALFSDIKGLVALKFIPLFSKFIPQNVKPKNDTGLSSTSFKNLVCASVHSWLSNGRPITFGPLWLLKLISKLGT